MAILGGSTTSTTTVSNLIVTAYDKLVEFNLRSEPLFRKFASKRPSDVTNPGNTVVFQLHNDLARVTTNLTQTTDVDAVAISNTAKVSVTVDEWGNVVQRTERAALEVLSQIDPAIADMLSYNIADSLDYQVYSILTGLATGRSGTGTANETSVNGSDKTAAGAAADTLAASDIRLAVARLRGAKVAPQEGSFYTALLHPDASYDLRTEAVGSGSNVWQQPHTYTEAGVGSMWTGEIGVYEGVKFIESPRVEQMAGPERTVTNSALTSNVVTITTAAAHGFAVGDVVSVTLDTPVANIDVVDATITAVGSSTTFSYAVTASNITTAATAGVCSILTDKVVILGKQALLEVVTYEPKTVIGPRIDALDRFRSVGWKFLGGWNIYRPEARYIIDVRSSI